MIDIPSPETELIIHTPTPYRNQNHRIYLARPPKQNYNHRKSREGALTKRHHRSKPFQPLYLKEPASGDHFLLMDLLEGNHHHRNQTPAKRSITVESGQVLTNQPPKKNRILIVSPSGENHHHHKI
ncbi:hypothetical protein ISN44_As09g006930 [Arabidopsis suecica]|uniref:Uncharacterized protein n=1 Tax=Arabidopsis suecica TaxID=45249 RepID=A0A8T2ADH7_ARASU|nr:hypothetical protein ISN44_As09g006930 [Arabidopsis suecica]